MKIIKKTPSFTLAEMMVVLVISTIVIATSFLVLQMVRVQIRNIQKSYQLKQEINTFENILYRDFSSGQAKFNTIGNVLTLKTPKDSILYIFKENYILRNKDKFDLETSSIKCYLNGSQVKNKTIDALEIQLSENFSYVQLFVHQTKDASYYMNK